jgi:hypothetical protein
MTRGREILLRKAFRLVWGEVQLQKIKPTEIVERFFNHQVRHGVCLRDPPSAPPSHAVGGRYWLGRVPSVGGDGR